VLCLSLLGSVYFVCSWLPYLTHILLAQAALMDIRKQQVASGSSQLEAEESSAVLQLLGVTKTLLANVSAQCTLSPKDVMNP
jgi:hypothetical protein